MHIIETAAYRKAFNQYLRKGTPIELSLKMMMQEFMHHKMLGNSTHYIWRTQEEGIGREEAIARVGNSSDFFGVPYGITDRWQTKFNGTVRMP